MKNKITAKNPILYRVGFFLFKYRRGIFIDKKGIIRMGGGEQPDISRACAALRGEYRRRSIHQPACAVRDI